MMILFIGDIVGKSGRDAALTLVPCLRSLHRVDLVIANAENVAGGWGITPPLASALLSGGIDVITMGNHTWAKEDGVEVLEDETRVLRPANYPPEHRDADGDCTVSAVLFVGVANLNGRAFMEPLDDPFRAADEFIGQIASQAKVTLIDFHAESSAEKNAFGWHCAGRVSAVVGTHTHVPTADERVLPGGTAYITDVGMCGPEDSVIGMDKDISLARFRTQLPHRYRVAEGQAVLNAALIDVDEVTGKARSITRVCRRDG